MSYSSLLNGIREGNYHAGGIRCLQLFRLQENYLAELKNEVMRLTQTECASDVTNPRHITNWVRPSGEVTQFSLFNSSGRYDDFSGDHSLSSSGKQFFGAHAYPILARLLASLPDLVNFRINLLGSGAKLSPHEEHSIVRIKSGEVVARVRFHLPIITAPKAELTLDGHVYHLMPGVIYLINHGCVHSAQNGSSNMRIHLVWDMLLSRAAFDVMFGESVLSLPIIRFQEHERQVTPIRMEHIGSYERIPPAITRDEADHLELWGGTA